VSGEAGDGHTPGFQVDKEEDVVCDETTPGQDLDGEEVCPGKDGHVGGDEVPPIGTLASFRRWCDAVALQNVPHRLMGDYVTEITERAGDAIVTPAFVLLSHADD